MQTPSESDLSRKAAAEQRVAEHLAWKRDFFKARPPPPPIGRLHRRQHGSKGGCPAGLTLKRARSIVREEAQRKGAAGRVETAEKETAGHSVAASSGDGDTTDPPTRQGKWLQQMTEEVASHNPFLDLNIRSDARRTTVMANLPALAVEEELRVFADQFGRVLNVRIVRDKQTGKSRRYAFVEFGLPAEAAKAVQYSRKKRLRGHAIIIDMERGRTEPGFLPKRLATARAIQGDTLTSSATGAPKAAPPAPPPTATSSNGTGASTMDDDDALLASILGEGCLH